MGNRLRCLTAVLVVAAAGCSHELSGPTPAPSVTDPALACVEQLVTEIALTGDGFAPLPTKALEETPVLELPTVTLVRTKTLEGGSAAEEHVVADDPAQPAASHVRWRNAQELAFDVYPELNLEPGLYSVRVKNRTGGEGTAADVLLALPRPTVTAIEPELLCTAKGGTLHVKGDFFLKIGDALPKIALGAQHPDVTAASDCRALPGLSGAQACRDLTVEVDADEMPAGVADAVVTNPKPADCHSTDAVHEVFVPPPVVEALVPGSMCTATGGLLHVQGANFLKLPAGAGAAPVVKIGPQSFTAAELSGCTDIAGLDDVDTCTDLSFEVPDNVLATLGMRAVTVTNPAPADCTSSAEIWLEVVPPPTVTGVLPTKLCAGGGRLAVKGTGFRDGSQVTVGEWPATGVSVGSATDLVATWGDGQTEGGPYDLTVTLPEGCGFTLAAAVTVVPGPRIFFVDPPVVYSGIPMQLSAYGSGLSSEITGARLWLDGATDGGTDLAVQPWDPTRPSRILINLPPGQGDGTYSLKVVDGTGCEAVLQSALKVVSQTTLEVTKVDPSFGWKSSDTGVTVFANPAVGGGFDPLPRLYLSRSTAGTPMAQALESVTLLGTAGDKLTAIVPAMNTAGTYRLIVVNPDGGLAVEEDAFKVTEQPPPLVDSVAPGSVENSSSAQHLTITGRNFRAPAVKLTCRATGVPDVETPAAVASYTDTEIDVTFNASQFSGGQICTVTVTDTDESTFADFAAIVITNPSAKLDASTPRSNLATPRRAPGAAILRLNNAQRFLFALGGDAGSPLSAMTSVESAPFDSALVPDVWTTQVSALTQARTFFGAVGLGRFLYAVGGSDGNGPLATVERAALLDPAFRPEITDIDLRIQQNGLGKGLWYYRVSAVLDGTDPFNPGGETLASERLPLLLPQLAGDRKLKLILKWSALPRAAGYRIYRSPQADAQAGTEKLLGTVPATSPLVFEDDGKTDLGESPLPLGSLGKWHPVVSMNSRRAGAAVVLAPDPATEGLHHLYAIDGLSDATHALNDWERLSITVESDGRQTLPASWTAGTGTFGSARWQLAATVGTPDIATRIPAGQVWIWAGAGVAANGTTVVDEVQAARVEAGGGLTITGGLDTPNAQGGGYAWVLAGNLLYSFGRGGSPGNWSGQAALCTSTECSQRTFPNVTNWSNTSVTGLAARQYAGTIYDGATMHLVGGIGVGSVILQSTEQIR